MEYITGNLITENSRTKTKISTRVASFDLTETNEAIDRLITEGGESFYNYVDWIGLAKDPNLIVLSSKYNYYYDSEEFNHVKTVINLKEFNRIKQIKGLLHSHLDQLPGGCNFIGCFVNNRKVDRYSLPGSSYSSDKTAGYDPVELGLVSRFQFLNRLYNFMDLKTNSYMSEKSVSLLLSVHGFKVIDMTELNGLTFFHSRKARPTYN